MKTLFAVIIILAMAMTAQAAPWLVCDPPPVSEGVTHYKLTGWSATQTPAPMHMDVASASVGTTNLTIAACRTNAWGEQCSVTVPFALVRPAPPSVPSGTALVP